MYLENHTVACVIASVANFTLFALRFFCHLRLATLVIPCVIVGHSTVLLYSWEHNSHLCNSAICFFWHPRMFMTLHVRCPHYMSGALAYAELGAMISSSGGEWVYMNRAIGPLNRHVGELPSFLYAWMMMVVMKPSSFAAVMMTFSKYMLSPFFDSTCNPPTVVVKLLTIAMICK